MPSASEPGHRARAAAAAIAPSDYDPVWSGYISLVQPGDIVRTLADQAVALTEMLRRVPEERGDYRYEPGKWTIKEVVGHVIDAERIFSYRALRFARGDSKPLQGFDQDAYVAPAGFGRRQLSSLVEEFGHVRAATVLLFDNLDDAAWERSGTANDTRVTVRALAYVTAGHELHHRRILEQKYGI